MFSLRVRYRPDNGRDSGLADPPPTLSRTQYFHNLSATRYNCKFFVQTGGI